MEEKNDKLDPSSPEFDFEAFKKDAYRKMVGGAGLLGPDGAFTSLMKNFLETSMDAEMDAHLSEKPTRNRRNGKGSKRVKTSIGEVDIRTPRDRDASFEPVLVPKRERVLGADIEEKIIHLYARGSSYQDISDMLSELYGTHISTATISRITDKVLPLVQEWSSRPLESTYCVLWLDAIHYKIRQEGKVTTKAVHCVIGVDLEGQKELLGMYMTENESASFWLHVLTDLQNRGVEQVLIACIDNLTGFADAIESTFVGTEVQLCIVHQIRNSLKFIPWKDQREFMKDLKMVYKADTLEAAALNLEKLDQRWGKKYPMVISSWRRNWERLTVYFSYTREIRKVIYTTNTVESFHRQLRKVTKTKGAFVSDTALMKLLYLAQEKITAKWTRPIYNWKSALAQFYIRFETQLKPELGD